MFEGLVMEYFKDIDSGKDLFKVLLDFGGVLGGL